VTVAHFLLVVMAAASSVGMMNDTFFVGRAELLAWVNDLLALSLTKVEQVHPGHIFCQIMDALHPGVVPMHKVNFEAKTEYDSVNNYKVLQSVFDKLKITKNIEVAKLIKGRPLDNLEFLQWMKCYFDQCTLGTGGQVDYNALERREKSKGGSSFVGGGGGNSGAASKPKAARGSAASAAPAREERASRPSSARARAAPASSSAGAAAGAKPTAPAPKEGLRLQLEEMKMQVERAEQERDFYFEKLTDVEALCQRPEFAGNPLIAVLEKFLYFEGATEKPDMDAAIVEALETAGQKVKARVTEIETGAAKASSPPAADAPVPAQKTSPAAELASPSRQPLANAENRSD